MIDGLYLPARPAIIIPKPAELVRSGDPKFVIAGGLLINPYAFGSIATYTTWNPSDKAAGVTLSGGNLTATHTGTNGTFQGVRSAVSKSTGKLYNEYTVTDATDDDDIRFGLAKTGASLTSALGSDTNSWSFEQVNTGADTNYRKRTNNATTSLTSTGQLGVDGRRIMQAWDADAGKLWWGVEGTWVNPDGNPGNGDPAAGTNPTFTSVTGTLFVMITMIRATTNVVTANFGTTAFAFTVPSGFTGWTTP